MPNRYTYETNAGRGNKAKRVSFALSDVEYGRLLAYLRAQRATAPRLTLSDIVRGFLQPVIGAPPGPRQD